MAIPGEKFFPKWFADNFVVFPPLAFLMSVLFGWGLFFEIDQRLMFAVSFADFLLIFIVFAVVVLVVVFGLLAVIAANLRRWRPLIVAHENRASNLLRALMYVAVVGSSFLAGLWNIYGGFVAGLIIALLFLVPALSAYERAELNRFRIAILVSLLGFSWMVMSCGRFAGRALMDGPKRVYSIQLQGGATLYANIVLYLSSGVIGLHPVPKTPGLV